MFSVISATVQFVVSLAMVIVALEVTELYFRVYNHDRLHQALQYHTPAEVYLA